MVYSSNSSTRSAGESDASNDPEDDFDTGVDVETGDAVSGNLTLLSREDGCCMVLFCAAGSDVMRACGTKGLCHRILPSSHKRMVETPTTHAPDGWFLPLAPNRRDSRVRDGLASSHRSDEDHQADHQCRQRWHQSQKIQARINSLDPFRASNVEHNAGDANEDKKGRPSKRKPACSWKPEEDVKLMEAVKTMANITGSQLLSWFTVEPIDSVVPDGSSVWILTAPRTQAKNTTPAMMKRLTRYRYDRMAGWHTLRQVFQLTKNTHGSRIILASLRYFRLVPTMVGSSLQSEKTQQNDTIEPP
jgi:hypothetical protein